MESIKTKDMMVSILDKYYPFSAFVISFVATAIVTYYYPIQTTQTFDNVLNATITCSSVLFGFTGVLLAILFSISNTEAIKQLFEHKAKDALKRYFVEALISEIVIIFASILLFIFNYQLLYALWISSVLYGLSSAYRIMSLMMHILFSPKEKRKKNNDLIMDDKSREELYKKARS